MSNIRKTDVKNHLSPRFRNKVFVSQSDVPAGATASAAGTESKANDSTKSALNLSAASGQKPVAGKAPKVVKD
jgi:hypothetical protein